MSQKATVRGSVWCPVGIVCLRVSACLCVALGFVLVGCFAGSAWGVEQVGSFGGFGVPRALGVDQGTGQVYVVDVGSGTVDRFDADGNGAPFTAVAPYVSGNQLTGGAGGAFSFGRSMEVAVDNSAGMTRGYVYVTDNLNQKVEVFAADGTSVGEVDPSVAHPESGGIPCGVAVSGSGDVFVAYLSGHIDKYVPADGKPADNVFVGQIESLEGTCDIAVNANGDVYGVEREFSELFKYKMGGARIPVEVTATAVAVNSVNDHVFIDQSDKLLQYGAAGVRLGGSFGLLGESFGVAVRGASGRIYASDESSATVNIFQAATAAVPRIDSEFSQNVASTSAELQAEVNPGVLDTYYYFEYGIDTSYGGGKSPVSGEIGIGEGEEDRPARAALSGLVPSSTYHYRVVARNKFGSVAGADETFTTFPSTSAALPDSRAWEMVSPLEKNSGKVLGIDKFSAGGVVQASVDGDQITFASTGSFLNAEGAPFASQYLSRRDRDAWSTQNITAPTGAAEYSLIGAGTPYKAFSETLESSLLFLGRLPVAPGAPEGYRDYNLRDNETGSFEALLQSIPLAASNQPFPASGFTMALEGATPDLSHIVISTAAVLSPEAVYNEQPNLYEWSAGQLNAINILPAETQSAPSAKVEFQLHRISDDGSRVFWDYTAAEHRALYVRENLGTPLAKTVQLDESRGAGASGRGVFWGASTDGSRAFFTDQERLTPDSSGAGDLYEYDLDRGTLTDLTGDSDEGAAVEGVAGVSDDGAYVYFVATGALAEVATKSTGGLPITGGENLYVAHDGELEFVTTLLPDDRNDWASGIFDRTTRVGRDGDLVFMSGAKLTGYENTGMQEVYLYDPHAAVLRCASCNPSGELPIGPSSIPAATQNENVSALYESRVISDDSSRVFFDTRDALSLQDTNHRADVYEYEGGAPHLISSGSANTNSAFVDASAKGDDVFFTTGQQLTSTDVDGLYDLYDARVNGGVKTPPVAPLCSGTGCQGLPSPPPIFATPATITFNGPGNYPPPPPKHATSTRKAKKGKKVTRRHATKRSGIHKGKATRALRRRG